MLGEREKNKLSGEFMYVNHMTFAFTMANEQYMQFHKYYILYQDDHGKASFFKGKKKKKTLSNCLWEIASIWEDSYMCLLLFAGLSARIKHFTSTDNLKA